MIYLVESAIQHLNNLSQDRKKKTAKCFCKKTVTELLLADSVLVSYKKICLKEAKVLLRIHNTRCYDLLLCYGKKIRDKHVHLYIAIENLCVTVNALKLDVQ